MHEITRTDGCELRAFREGCPAKALDDMHDHLNPRRIPVCLTPMESLRD